MAQLSNPKNEIAAFKITDLGQEGLHGHCQHLTVYVFAETEKELTRAVARVTAMHGTVVSVLKGDVDGCSCWYVEYSPTPTAESGIGQDELKSYVKDLRDAHEKLTLERFKIQSGIAFATIPGVGFLVANAQNLKLNLQFLSVAVVAAFVCALATLLSLSYTNDLRKRLVVMGVEVQLNSRSWSNLYSPHADPEYKKVYGKTIFWDRLAVWSPCVIAICCALAFILGASR